MLCLSLSEANILRGAIIKKNEKIWEKFPNGGGVKIKKIKSQFQFGNFEGPGGGSQFFKNVPISVI